MIALFQNDSSSWFAQSIASIREAVAESFKSLLNAAAAELPYLIAGIIVFFLFWLAARIISLLFLSATRKVKVDERIRLLTSRLIVAGVIIIGVIAALTVAIPSFNLASVVAGLGFTSFVIGFAAKDIVNNFLSGMLILWQQPFYLGDYVFVGGNQGKVEFIGVRATNLRKDDGELVLVPNGEMYSTAVTIRAANEPRRMALKLALPFGVDLADAKATILDAVERSEGVVTDPRPKVLASELSSAGITVNVTFWIATNESKPLTVLDGVVALVADALKENDITPFESDSDAASDIKADEPKPKKKTDQFSV